MELVKTTANKTIIEPQTGWQLIDWRELWRYREAPHYFNLMSDIAIRVQAPRRLSLPARQKPATLSYPGAQ